MNTSGQVTQVFLSGSIFSMHFITPNQRCSRQGFKLVFAFSAVTAAFSKHAPFALCYFVLRKQSGARKHSTVVSSDPSIIKAWGSYILNISSIRKAKPRVPITGNYYV